MIKLLKSNEEYENNLKQYTKKDGILALALFAIIMIEYSVFGILRNNFDFVNKNIMIFSCICNLLMIIITILFVKLNKQKIDTIGIFKGKWKMSIFIGVILAIFYSCNNCISYLVNGSKLVPLNQLPMLIIYYLLVSVCEEFVFRGYIGTRIYGFFKNKYIAICLTGILFIIMHFPYRMIAYGMTLSDLTINNFEWLLDLFITHIVLNFIYLKTNSLYGSIIPHWMSNLSYNIILK
ncbi:MAG: CPBP family intramembrane glutamic endopeptidase [Clostridia bacterium]